MSTCNDSFISYTHPLVHLYMLYHGLTRLCRALGYAATLVFLSWSENLAKRPSEFFSMEVPRSNSAAIAKESWTSVWPKGTYRPAEYLMMLSQLGRKLQICWPIAMASLVAFHVKILDFNVL